MRKGDDWDEDERAGGGGSTSRIPLQPPRRPDLYETEEEWRVRTFFVCSSEDTDLNDLNSDCTRPRRRTPFITCL